VSCSERCRRGLRARAAARASRSWAAAPMIVLGAWPRAGRGRSSLYHQAMSWGLTNETVVHHGSVAAPSWANQSSNWRGDVRVHAPALAGRAVGRGVGAAREAVALERGGPKLVHLLSVGEVPLAVPVGVVAVLAQHRAPGREAGSSVLPPVIMQPVWCVYRPVSSVAREGRAVVGGGVVAGEAETAPRAGARGWAAGRTAPGAGPNHCGKRSWSTMITRMFGCAPRDAGAAGKRGRGSPRRRRHASPRSSAGTRAAAAAAVAQVGAPSCTPQTLDASAQLDGAVTVSPMPGAADASPSTQISFLGVPLAALGDVTVTGSVSGRAQRAARALLAG
jgi:hypothetical protein